MNPVGHVTPKEAVEILARKLGEGADVPLVLAEAFESGAVVATYRESRGIRLLDPKTWHSPAWRIYFETGTVDLVLPLLNDDGQPHPQGFTARCACEIFVRTDSLASFIADLEPAPIAPPAPFRNAPPDLIRKKIRAVYLDPANDRPNVGKLPEFVRPRLNALGFEASGRQIIKIGGEPEFVSHRRKPGKTKASERPR